MGFPLEGQTLVITGTFDFVSADDAHWALVAKGAKVATAVTRSTSAVVAGADPLPRIVEGAKKHGTPVLGPEGLRALLAGATLAAARGASAGVASQPLAGHTVLLCTKLPRGAGPALRATLERLGARVVAKCTNQTTLAVMGDAPGFDAIDALDAGVPPLSPDDVAALEAGTPLGSFVGRRDLEAEDVPGFVAARLAALAPALLDIDLGGERFEDTLTVTLLPGGRVCVALSVLGGTPTEAHVRRIVTGADWPAVDAPCQVAHPLTFGGH